MNAPHEFDERGLREPPAAIEAEQSVLGALLLDSDAIDRIGGLSAEHFYRYDHRLIFETIQRLVLSGRTADVITVFEALGAAGKVDAVGGLAYLNALVQNTPGSAGIARWAEIVVNRWKQRGLISAADEIAENAFNPQGKEVGEIIADVQARLESLAESQNDAPRTAAESLGQLLCDLDAEYHGAASTATATGFADLDDRLDGGLRGGELVIVAGRPGTGKSAFAMSIASHVTAAHGPALFFSLEMPAKQLHARNLARIAGIPLGRLKNGAKLHEADWPHLTDAVQQLAKLPLFVDESASLSVADIAARSRAIKRKHGLAAIVVDYLGLVRLGKEERHDLQIAAATRSFKLLAKQLDVPVILLAQLNRELERRTNRRPQMSDLRDSGAIEQDADVILFIYRDELYDPDTPDRGIAEIIIGKHRNGALGKIGLAFDGDRAKFADLAPGCSFGRQESRSSRTRGFE